MMALVTLSFFITVFVFKDEWGVLSYPTLHLLGLALSMAAALAVSRHRLVAAGLMMVLMALIGANGVTLLSRHNDTVTGLFLSVPIYSAVPLVTALVLPRRWIIPASVLSIISYSLIHFTFPAETFTGELLQPQFILTTVILLVLFQGILLHQLRVEFDARLLAMMHSIVETEQAKQQAEIARLQAEADRRRAEDADHAKTEFLANISHELRTPLNAIIGYDEAMLAGMAGVFTEQQYKLLERIQHNSRRLLNLINDVLDLSKIEAGALEVYWAPMEPAQVIGKTMDGLRSLAEEKGLSLRLDVARSTPRVVVSDPNKVEQIVVNLLGNAIKFTDVGEVRVKLRGQPDSWQITITDTGVGIPPQALASIFDPFQQVNGSLKRKYRGTGLGLSITKQLVTTLSGTISVESELDKGSTFVIVLPLQRTPSITVPDNEHTDAAQ
jgi:signal transduction histidine kinase